MIDAGFSLRTIVQAAAFAAFTLGVSSVAGCARDARPAIPVQAQGATAGLRVYVKTFANADATALVKSYSAAMRWAGFVTVAQEKDAELVAELRLRVEDATGDAERLAEVELTVKGKNVELGTTSVEYDYNAPIPASELSRLTSAATMSEALDSYALEIQQQELASTQRSVEL